MKRLLAEAWDKVRAWRKRREELRTIKRQARKRRNRRRAERREVTTQRNQVRKRIDRRLG